MKILKSFLISLIVLLILIVGMEVFLIIQEQKNRTSVEEDLLKTPYPTPEIPSDWKTYRNEEYGFEIKYPEEELPLDQGGPLGKTNVFYFGSEPYEYRISLVIFDASEEKKYPLSFNKYTKVNEIVIDNEMGTKYEYEYEVSAGFERGGYYEFHIRREITVEVEKKSKIYRFHLNRTIDYPEIFEIFDKMLATFRFIE